MKKFLIIFIITITLISGHIMVYAQNESAGGTGGSNNDVEGGVTRPWYYAENYPGNSTIKITAYQSDGTKVGSKFFVNNNDDLGSLNGKAYIRTNGTDRLYESTVQGNWIKSSTDTFSYLNFSQVIGNTNNKSIKSFLSNLSKEIIKTTYGLSDDDLKDLVLIIEPATTVKKSNGDYYVGTYWDFIALKTYDSGFKSNIVTPVEDLGSSISIKSDEVSQTNTPNIWEFLTHFNTFQGNVTKQQSLGVAIILYSDLFEEEDETIENDVNKTQDCEIKVGITGCGESYIEEPSTNECLGYNPFYSYLPSCNVFCSEKIETDFGGFYNTFKNEEVLYKAIKSGRFIEITSSPNIKVTKTCYHTGNSPECSNWKESLKSKIESEYNVESKLTLKLDGGDYIFTDSTPTISKTTDNTSNVVYEILYEHIIKPIDYKFFKFKPIGNNYSDTIVKTDNGKGGIIINKKTLGSYDYKLDITSTKLNKYADGSSYIPNSDAYTYSYTETDKVGNTTYITNHNYEFNNTINNDYEEYELKFNCTYNAYDPDESCICKENTVCNDKCEEVPGEDKDPCTCVDAPCGCKDNLTCTPNKCPVLCPPDVPCPTPEECDPKTEICFPNVVYRPISLTNPFPGMGGSGRIPGKNWDGVARYKNGDAIYYKGSKISLSDYYIKYNRGYNGYEVYQAEPLYVINLDADKIKKIREYNDYKNHDYNNFEGDFECTDGKCISKFLRGKADGFNINLINGGTCQHITHTTFDSCVTRKGA